MPTEHVFHLSKGTGVQKTINFSTKNIFKSAIFSKIVELAHNFLNSQILLNRSSSIYHSSKLSSVLSTSSEKKLLTSPKKNKSDH